MVDRLLITLIILMLALGMFLILRYAHARRASRYRLASAGGLEKPTLLYFRSDSCAPCITQAKALDNIETKYEGKLSILSIDAEKEPQIAEAYGVFTLPTTFVLDTSGTVRQINYGLTGADKLMRQMEQIL